MKQIVKNEAAQMIGVMFIGLFNVGILMTVAMFFIAP